MLDYINDDLNENDVREDDILMHLEDLWNQSTLYNKNKPYLFLLKKIQNFYD